MPVIVHQAIAQDAHSRVFAAFLQQLDECLKISRLLKNSHPPIAAIEHVINRIIRQLPQFSRHAGDSNTSRRCRK